VVVTRAARHGGVELGNACVRRSAEVCGDARGLCMDGYHMVNGGNAFGLVVFETGLWAVWKIMNLVFCASLLDDDGSMTSYIMHPLLLLECRSEMLKRTLCPLIIMKLSTSHSYQTLRSSVCLQKLTSTSELAGSCSGVCNAVSICDMQAETV
jgi:hypothetical protein